MVTETHHNAFVQECTVWQQRLQDACTNLQNLQQQLYHFAAGRTVKDLLVEVEHFHNQFHIQLINLHDLKHEVRAHQIEVNNAAHFSVVAPHHQLKEKLESLLNELRHLTEEFNQFIKRNP